jgi:hypothetical protein
MGALAIGGRGIGKRGDRQRLKPQIGKKEMDNGEIGKVRE